MDLVVVLLHGIGDIAPGQVVEAVVRTLQKRLGADVAQPARPLSTGVDKQAGDHARVASTELAWRGRNIAIVEFNWTTVAGKIRLLRPLDALAKFAAFLAEFPRVGASARHPRLQKVAAWAGAFQRGLLLVTLAAVAASVIEIVLRTDMAERVAVTAQRALTPGDHPLEIETLFGTVPIKMSPGEVTKSPNVLAAAMAVMWSSRELLERRELCTLAVQTLYFTAFLYYTVLVVGYIYFLPIHLIQRIRGRRLSAANGLWRTLAVSSFVMFLVSLAAFELPVFALCAAAFVRHPETFGVTSAWDLSFYAAVAGFTGWLLLRVSAAISNLLRDVIHYLAPDASGSLLPHQRKIREELAQLLTTLTKTGPARLVLVAHSLGTVIVTDMLCWRAHETTTTPAVTIDLVTAGSPLRRTIARLLPDRPRPLDLRDELRRAGVERWFNYHRLLDYVGQALTWSALPLDLVGWPRKPGDPTSGIRDRLLTPRWRWPLFHAEYWSDPRFLKAIAEEVVMMRLGEV